MSTPVPMTSIVIPPPKSAPRCAAASQPSARPLTTTTPARARSAASCSATASPYGDGRRDPTIATRGHSGGGHLPRAFRALMSGGDVTQSISQCLKDVSVGDQIDAFEVGRGPRYAPGPVKTARGQTFPFRPALEGVSRAGLQGGQASQPARPELGVEATLTSELAGSRRQDPFPDRYRRLAARLRGKLRQRNPPHADLEVDAVEERAGQPALIRVDDRRRATTRADGIAEPATRARIRGGDQREERRVGDRAAGPGDGHHSGFERLPQRLQHVGLKLGELVQEEHSVIGAADLAWQRVPGAAPDEPRHRDAVMRSAEGTRPVDGATGPKVAQQAPDLRHIECLT